MRVITQDPETIVGLTSFVEIVEDPSRALVGGVEYDIPDSQPLIAYQSLDYLRAFYNNRIAWSRLEFMLCAVGAFQVWRRDLLEELQRLVARLHLRGHRAHVPRARGAPRAGAPVPGGLPPRSCRGDGRAGHRAQAGRAAGALAARDPRDLVGVPAHVLQQALRRGRPSRHALLPRLGDRRPRLRARGGHDTARRRAVSGLVDWWEFAFVTLAITLRQQRVQHRARC